MDMERVSVEEEIGSKIQRRIIRRKNARIAINEATFQQNVGPKEVAWRERVQ